MPLNAREAALKALIKFRKNQSRSEDVLDGVLRSASLADRDAALSARIFYGVLQNKMLLQYYVIYFSTLDAEKIEATVWDILYIAAYQMLFLSKIPPSAAVNESVKLAKKYSGQRSIGFVNAILRKISSNLDRLPEVKGRDETERLSIRYSHPYWLVREIAGRLGTAEAEKLLEADNQIVPIYAQINTLCKQKFIAALDEMMQRGQLTPHKWLDSCVEFHGGFFPGNSQLVKDGAVYIQDPAARLAVTAADPTAGMRVIDGCAAPGGKSFAAAIDMKNSGSILACDLSAHKLSKIIEGADRLGISIIETRALDARTKLDELAGRADLVFADVPCSGFGTIRKKPEIRYKNEAELEGLPQVQFDILSNLSNYVNQKGVLLYSTCTILRRENEDVVARFLDTRGDFTLEPFDLPEPVGRVAAGQITLWPHIYGTDGFFIARLRRRP